MWLARVENERLLVSWSDDLGKVFSPATVVTPVAEKIGADGENRPKIKVTRNGTILLTWTQLLPERLSGNIRFSRSTDGGKTFSTPITLNDDGRITSHRFESLITDGHGNVAVAWIDARDRDLAKENGQTFTGVSLYFTRSTDNGATFVANQRLQQHTCECCRIGAAWSRTGPTVFWRNIFNQNTRDFALANLDSGKVSRVTDDDWQVDACPHHGGDLAIDVRDVKHLIWFTNSNNRQGLYYRSISGTHMSVPMPVGNLDALPGHPSIAASGLRILLAWREFDGEKHTVMAMHSTNGGTNWSSPELLASTDREADYPIALLPRSGRSLVIWNTAAEGLRVLAVNEHKQHKN